MLAITTAIVVTILWSLIDKKRKSYTRADFWLRHTLRFVLAIIIFSYGIQKLIPVQMPMPDTATLDAPVGYFPPGGLFWTLMGSNTFYQSFTGLVEVTVALLFVFSRTYVIGLIVLTGTLVNILMLNIGFDIGATYVVLVLLTACVYLLFPYLKSIIYFLLNKQPIKLYEQPKPDNRLYRTIFILSTALFIASAFFNIRHSRSSYNRRVKNREDTKTFNVITQTYNADTLKMTVGDKARWKYWIQYKRDKKKYLSILTMNDTVSYDLLFQDDTMHRIIQLRPEEQLGDTTQYTFFYKTGENKSDKTLTDSLHKIKLVIKEFDKERWELLKSRNKFFPFDF
ncbi:MAG: hypothetical protein M3Z92_06720 [Bacteroidota bacterium]|nr:hypothetical protein [Bacteroidota bacterium]